MENPPPSDNPHSIIVVGDDQDAVTDAKQLIDCQSGFKVSCTPMKHLYRSFKQTKLKEGAVIACCKIVGAGSHQWLSLHGLLDCLSLDVGIQAKHPCLPGQHKQASIPAH